MKPVTWTSLALALVLLVLLPLVFGQLMAAALVKLDLSKRAAFALVAAMMIGGLINIPIKRIRSEEVMSHPLHPSLDDFAGARAHSSGKRYRGERGAASFPRTGDIRADRLATIGHEALMLPVPRARQHRGLLPPRRPYRLGS